MKLPMYRLIDKNIEDVRGMAFRLRPGVLDDLGLAKTLALRIAKGSGEQSPLDSLAMRELQVLRRLAIGHTNREIAGAYSISIKTVDTYRSRLLKKMTKTFRSHIRCLTVIRSVLNFDFRSFVFI
jgi:DNA-binding CsgD family transcriptional regulator